MRRSASRRQFFSGSSDCERDDNGEAGFERLRKSTRQNSEFFKELIAILDERAELEIGFSKNLLKLSSRLSKASKTTRGVIDSSWKFVSDSMESEGTVHKNLGLALKEEIVQPLRSVFESQHKTKKTIEQTVDKALKQLNDKRTEQLKLKRQSYCLAKECEKVQRTTDEELRRPVRVRTEKQMAKKLAKRQKLEQSTGTSEEEYKEVALGAEKERQDLELVMASAAARMEDLEQQRLANLQTALGRYQRNCYQLGPSLIQMTTRHMEQLDGALAVTIQSDLKATVAHCHPRQLAYRVLVLCDYYAEDFSQIMDPERRRLALQRLLASFQRELQREKKGKEGLEYLSSVYDATPAFSSPESRSTVRNKLRDTCTSLSFLDFHLYKLKMALDSLDKKTVTGKDIHPLSRFEEKHKDKAGLRQTVLRVPMHASEELYGTDSAGSSSTRQDGDGQSPIVTPPPETETALEPIYESVNESKPEEAEENEWSEESESEGTCEALYDFLPQREDELELKAGSRLEILRRISEDWWEGRVVGQELVGLFPTNYVHVL